MRIILIIIVHLFFQDIYAQNAVILLEENDSTHLDLTFINDTVIKISSSMEKREENFLLTYKFINDTLMCYNQKDLKIFEDCKIFTKLNFDKSQDSIEFVFYCFSTDFFTDNQVYSRMTFEGLCLEFNNQQYNLKPNALFKTECDITSDIYSSIKIKKNVDFGELILYTKQGELIIQKNINILNKNKVSIRCNYHEGKGALSLESKRFYYKGKNYVLKVI